MLFYILPGHAIQVPIPIGARLYCAGLAALATLLVLLTIARSPVKGYLASVEFRRQVHSGRDPLRNSDRPGREGDPLRRIQEELAEQTSYPPQVQRLGKPGRHIHHWRVTCQEGTSNEARQSAARAATVTMAALDEFERDEMSLRAERFSRYELQELKNYEDRAREELASFLLQWSERAESPESGVSLATNEVTLAPATGSSEVSGDNPAERLQELREQFERTAEQRAVAEQENEANLRRVLASATVVRSWQIKAGGAVERVGGRVSGLAALASIVAAVGVGCATFWWSGRRRAPSNVESPDQLAELLEAPVIASLGQPAGTSARLASRMHPGVRATTHLAELLVGVFLVAIGVLLTGGSPWLADLFTDVFSTLADVLPRAISTWLG